MPNVFLLSNHLAIVYNFLARSTWALHTWNICTRNKRNGKVWIENGCGSGNMSRKTIQYIVNIVNGNGFDWWNGGKRKPKSKIIYITAYTIHHTCMCICLCVYCSLNGRWHERLSIKFICDDDNGHHDALRQY